MAPKGNKGKHRRSSSSSEAGSSTGHSKKPRAGSSTQGDVQQIERDEEVPQVATSRWSNVAYSPAIPFNPVNFGDRTVMSTIPENDPLSPDGLYSPTDTRLGSNDRYHTRQLQTNPLSAGGVYNSLESPQTPVASLQFPLRYGEQVSLSKTDCDSCGVTLHPINLSSSQRAPVDKWIANGTELWRVCSKSCFEHQATSLYDFYIEAGYDRDNAVEQTNIILSRFLLNCSSFCETPHDTWPEDGYLAPGQVTPDPRRTAGNQIICGAAVAAGKVPYHMLETSAAGAGSRRGGWHSHTRSNSNISHDSNMSGNTSNSEQSISQAEADQYMAELQNANLKQH